MSADRAPRERSDDMMDRLNRSCDENGYPETEQ